MKSIYIPDCLNKITDASFRHDNKYISRVRTYSILMQRVVGKVQTEGGGGQKIKKKAGVIYTIQFVEINSLELCRILNLSIMRVGTISFRLYLL